KNLRTPPAALDDLDLKTPAGKVLEWRAWFSSSVTRYTVKIPEEANTLEVTPVAYWPNYKKLTVNGTEVKSGATHVVKLSPDENRIEVTVTGNDGSTKTYTVQAAR
ncbi:MAG TPA: cadherin-like beta sandwich domain-containing protein, partial [Terriglobia bacterium]|nr:cadherin-like beta sandwich domain-containing protein [Terriglobia bacterium]